MQQLQSFITRWKLNMPILASKMGMAASTFKNKLNPNLPAYRFTEAEEKKLIDVLRELTADIEKVAGMSIPAN